MVSKNLVRSRLNFLRQNCDFKLSKVNSIICSNVDFILQYLLKNFNDKKVLGIYSALEGEPDISKLMFYDFWDIALPQLSIKDNSCYMKMILFDFNKEKLVHNKKFGVLEPSGDKEVVADIILLPGIGFDLEGYRIGFGKGIYDRYLSRLKDSGVDFISIGVCFHKFLIESFTKDYWDFKMNFVITEQIILRL